MSEEKKVEKDQKKKISIPFILKALTVVVLTFLTVLLSSNYYKEDLEKQRIYFEEQEVLRKIELERARKAALITNAKEAVKLLYIDNVPKDSLSAEELLNAENKIELIEDDDQKNNLNTELNEVKQYITFSSAYQTIYPNKILIANVDENTYNEFLVTYDNLKQEWKDMYASDIEDIKLQKSQMTNAYNSVVSLFTSLAMTTVKANVTRTEHTNAVKVVALLKQENLKQDYNNKLNVVIKKIEEREAYQKRQEEIKKAWVVLSTPYISQNYAKIYNGCEGASLLMAVQYKGYLKNKTLADVAAAMPKSDNPHEGFYLDIYGTEPKTESHWIAPDALSKFGREYSGNSKIFNATGYSFSQLEQELSKGNPVIIYVTGGELNNPVWKEGQEVPVNLHVILLVGYNNITKQVIVKDPWTHNESSKYKYYSESRITSIYNQVGKKAVVVG